MAKQSFGFTLKVPGRANGLITAADIYPAFDPLNTKTQPLSKKHNAIWDTGATSTVISSRVVNELALKPIAMTKVQTAAGVTNSNVYLINIGLPNHVGIPNVRVTEGNLGGNCDVLIGMDIITEGDFAITHHDGKTTFSFRIPSMHCVDYVEQINKMKTAGRNDPCPCGSGHKYKKCCGK